MLALSPKRLAYTGVLAGLLILAVVAGLGIARGIAHSQTAQGDDTSIGLLRDAQGLMEQAANLDNTDPFQPEDFKRLYESLGMAIALHEDGDVEGAVALARRLAARVEDMAAMTKEHGNVALYDILLKTHTLLAEYIRMNAPEPQPVPSPVPQPLVQWVYSSKFVCGSEQSRQAGFTPDLGNHPAYYSEESYDTEINIHNFSDHHVGFWVKAVQANPMGAPRGAVSQREWQVLGPNQAMQVNCRNIRAMLLPDPPHVVCQGKYDAIRVLEGLLNLDATAADALVPEVEHCEVIKGLVEALHKAIRLEEAGELRQALQLEREIVQKLDRLIAVAEEQGRERLALRLSEARAYVQRCIRILVADIEAVTDAAGADANALTILPRIRDGFVAIETPWQLEVTAVYRARSANKSIEGGVGSGISIDVEQIQPHRVSNVLPLPPIEPIDPIEPPVILPAPEPTTSAFNTVQVSPRLFSAIGSGYVLPVAPGSYEDGSYDYDDDDDADNSGPGSVNSKSAKFYHADSDLAR
ncbi:MAG: hypothetical protein L0177_16085 [Chloroflexi bacterium]|nr:hypothetical protein [Chloroflexota bacterium]